MSATFARLRESRAWWFDLSILIGGLTLFAMSAVEALQNDDLTAAPLIGVACIALTVIVARFPMVLDHGDGGIEVGFDSAILMFLLSTLHAHDALVVWSVGVILTQVTTGKRLSSKLFNIGVGILAGWFASQVLVAVRGDGTGTPQELAAVALAAVAYFLTDYVVSAVSVAIETRSSVRGHLLQRGTLMAVACFVPFDTLGYLGAVVYRATPWWTLSLLAVPLVTLLIATRAVTRGRENARRLTVLFDAAVRAQTLSDRSEIVDALLEDARELLHIKKVALRPAPPGRAEIGALVHTGENPSWIVARAVDRARSTVSADEQALRALAAVASDAFGRLELTEEMVHVARHDPLTDLPNRGILLDRVTDSLALARETRTRAALLFIDLDGFKPVNDRFGHAAGDAVLVELAGRLRDSVREVDTVARVGGDEFAVLFEDADNVEVEVVCERVLAAVNEGVYVAGQRLPLSASAGIAYGGSDDDAEGLLRKADLAMYEAKANGKARVMVYREAIGRSRLERLVMVDDLRQAVSEAEINVVYQPIVAADTGLIVGAEALARWSRGGAPVAPDVFIRVAEETGVIVELGDVVLSKVAADTAALRKAVDGPIVMSVNISARQLRDPGFVSSVQRAVAAMEGAELVLEITEREGINVDPLVLASMRAISAMGVRFAIDDFGIGFSSISYLHDLPVQIIKADKALSQDIDTDERANALLRSVTLMGQTLGLEVVVEGIERESQLAILRDDTHELFVQGFLMYRPMPPDQLVSVLQEDRAPARGPGRTLRPWERVRMNGDRAAVAAG